MGNKKVTIAVIVLMCLVVFGGIGFFVVKGMNSKNTSEQSNSQTSEVIKTLTPEDIGLTLQLNPRKNGLVMKIENLDGIKSIEYEGTYDAKVTEGADILTVTKGFGPSTIEVKPTDKVIVRDDLIFGTCSRNVCKYDDVTSDVTVTLRINYVNGEVGSIEQKISLKK